MALMKENKLKDILFFTTIFLPVIFLGFILGQAYWLITWPFRYYYKWLVGNNVNDKKDD